ncbi:MAG: hypothetical protein RBU30_13780 [Polyangia bacterium]|nr:hypothetical protein [Polyangia bacterium]
MLILFLFLLPVALGACRKDKETTGESGAKGGMEAGNKAGPDEGHLGKAFTLEEITPLAGILAEPKAFEGKTVRVQGLVVSHCHHKLAWFGLKVDTKAKDTLRVMTAPDFLVPKDVKHGVTRASAEGVVELKTVPETHAKHLAKEHGLFGGEPDKIQGPQYVASLRASGASFQ